MEGFFNGSKEIAELLLETGREVQNAGDMLACERDEFNREMKEIGGVMYRYDVTAHRWVPFEQELPEDEPVPDMLEFFTLSGLVDYININSEGLIPTDGTRLILQVVNERRVELLSQPSLHRKERHVIAWAEAHTPGITFERYMDSDSFATELLSKFIDTVARATLFSVIKSMTKEQSATITDDGVGQNITVKSGVSMAGTLTFQNPVPLRPRRTFAEVEQPESNFTLRVDQEANAALFESDGGAWKLDAVNAVREYLAQNIENPAVVVLA